MDSTRTSPLSDRLLNIKNEICNYAKDQGLDFYDVIFEVCNYDTINILASQGGFPGRYPHWRFGMAYDQMYKGYSYGLQKIYEMVINTKPCYAYLLKSNPEIDQKIVMAHVYGHADFFKNNFWFANTDLNMMDVMANHGVKIRRYMDKYGQDKVEAFIDKVLSLEDLIDTNILFKRDNNSGRDNKADDDNEENGVSNALKSFMNSKNRLESKVIESQHDKIEIDVDNDLKCGEVSPRDIMNYMLNHAPLEEWESDILGILREEAYYFLPQRLTKIMNEGWASYWHSKIMTSKFADASEIVHFADHHAGVMAMSKKKLNPYKIGIELFRDIEHRWNRGKFGKDYNECNDLSKKHSWNTNLGLGISKIFEVRKTHNDITFIDEFFTPEFCERQQIFTYSYNSSTGRNEIKTREFEKIKKQILNQLTNFGTPMIEVESGNYENKGELLLKHIHHDKDLDIKYTEATMKNIFYLWKRPVNLKTIIQNKEVVFNFDGIEFKQI